MNRERPLLPILLSAALVLFALAGCARVDFEESLARTNRTTAGFTDGNLALAQTDEQRAAMAKTAATLLTRPLSQQDAVHLALVNSPAIQAMLARNWAEAARAAQSGRIANPWFVFARTTLADEVEFERALTFGLLDLLTLPLRYPAAMGRMELARVRLALDTVDTVTTVRQAWVRAVAARERLVYAQQVYEVGEISAELAAACSRWATSADCSTPASRPSTPMRPPAWPRPGRPRPPPGRSWSNARPLGYPGATAAAADACPTCRPARGTRPRSARRPARPGSTCSWPGPPTGTAAREQGLNRVTSLTDIELGIRHDTVFDDAAGSRDNREGYEISIRLPVFDWRCSAMPWPNPGCGQPVGGHGARGRVEPARNLRRLPHGLGCVPPTRDEVLPLRRVIAEENLLHYNGMLIGVFELLADTRDQVRTVITAIEARRDFWLADGGSAGGRHRQTGHGASRQPAGSGWPGSPGGPLTGKRVQPTRTIDDTRKSLS